MIAWGGFVFIFFFLSFVRKKEAKKGTLLPIAPRAKESSTLFRGCLFSCMVLALLLTGRILLCF